MKIAVVGAGPAGMICAYKSSFNDNATVFLFDKNEKLGKKLFITGKGRCNLTNNCNPKDFLNNVVSNPRFLKTAINTFKSTDTIALIEKEGHIPLKTERGNRVFPLSDKSSDIIKGFKRILESRSNINIYLNSYIQSIESDNNKYYLKINNKVEEFDILVLACGGMSYKSTGSNGDGYNFARQLRHKIVPTVPGLIGISIKENISHLSGLSLKNVSASICDNENKILYSEFGEMLFTHKGVSGPIILSLSSRINRMNLNNLYVSIDLKPALDNKTLDDRLLRDLDKYKSKTIKNALNDLLLQKLIDEVLLYSKINPDKKVSQISKNDRNVLINSIKNLKYKIKCLDSIDYAIVTAGGVDISDINNNTMESLIHNNLYFCGEILDVDALTGGFNIQIALSTGYLAGQSISRKILG